ncbi:MAG: EAL domain-containing protein [Lachnospiraceae bacterium]|nr:EAL domain-containing protein [Lachnospiraceae bacterium]
MKQQILIVEDNILNQKILMKNLQEDYSILQAFNGKEALAVIRKQYAGIAAVILDLRMPEMDGEELLEILSKDKTYKNLPILVATGEHDEKMESRCLELGAWDFVTKPYSPKVIHLRLENIIGRSQMILMEKIRILSERDYLTDLYNRAFFMEKTKEMIQKYPEKTFVLIRMDVDNFRLYNSTFGSGAGDELLKSLADLLRQDGSYYQTYGRIESDVFCICTLYEPERLRESLITLEDHIQAYSRNYRLQLSFGLYVIRDIREDMEKMYSCTVEASHQCKRKINTTYMYYDEEMSREEAKIQRITTQMETAIREKQFEVYLQPKYSLDTNLPCGAEALVRWRHPEHGMISPGEFIPVFEKNGQIMELDYYMWENTCILLHKWIEEGREVYPISVNVSRISLYNPQIVEAIVELTEKYQVPKHLLNLEITETAYMSNPDLMKDVTQKLRSHGFVLLMDDFGSGYSSLNTLKDIDLDILKIDMKFLPSGSNNVKSEKILASVIRMAGWLGMPVVVEGVETKEQKEFLESIGCSYVQGYYFARPMPVEEYETLVHEKKSNISELPSEMDSLTESLDAIWSSDAAAMSLLKSVSIPFAVYEYANSQIDSLRTNQAYNQVFGRADQVRQRLNNEELFKLFCAMDQAVYTKDAAECECLYVLEDGSSRWYHIRMMYIGSSVKTSLLGLTFTDVTTERNLERELNNVFGMLKGRRVEKESLLVVDDSSISREILCKIFEGEYTMIQACDGDEALEILQEHADHIAAILLDMIMPKMSGQEFLAYKNQIAEASDIPVIVISAESGARQQIHMLQNGVNDYVTKPFVAEVVYRRLHNVLEYHSRFKAMIEEYQCAKVQEIQGKSFRHTDMDATSKMIYTDSLTNAYNRRFFDEMMFLYTGEEHTATKVGLVMMDLYQFKQINDSYGHQMGDTVLTQIVQVVKEQIRKSDSLIRYGGDEFLIVFPDCTKAHLLQAIQRLEKAICDVHYGTNRDMTARADFGYAYTLDFHKENLSKLLKKADSMMYKNKKERRKQCKDNVE